MPPTPTPLKKSDKTILLSKNWRLLGIKTNQKLKFNEHFHKEATGKVHFLSQIALNYCPVV